MEKVIVSILVIGGETIYKHFMKKNYYNKLLLNEIKWPENNIGNKSLHNTKKTMVKLLLLCIVNSCIAGMFKINNNLYRMWQKLYDIKKMASRNSRKI